MEELPLGMLPSVRMTAGSWDIRAIRRVPVTPSPDLRVFKHAGAEQSEDHGPFAQDNINKDGQSRRFLVRRCVLLCIVAAVRLQFKLQCG